MSTKQEEREALEQIKTIVQSLGSDSYLSFAFKGCFEDAESNIENDFANSYYERYKSEQSCMQELSAECDGLSEENKRLREEIDDMEYRYDIAYKKLNETKGLLEGAEDKAAMFERQLNDAQKEIVQLKAKLYDLMCK